MECTPLFSSHCSHQQENPSINMPDIHNSCFVFGIFLNHVNHVLKIINHEQNLTFQYKKMEVLKDKDALQVICLKHKSSVL